MTDVVGRGVIEVVGDNTKLKATIDDSKRDIKSLGTETGNSLSEGAAKATRAIDAYIKRIEASAASVGKTARETKLLELAQQGATQAQLKAADAALSTIEAYKLQQTEARKAADVARTAAAIAAASQTTQGNATKLTAYQTQQLSFQLNDLFVQIASGQSPVTALIQQGSQLNGTFGGFGGTMRAIGSLLSVTRVAVGGLVGVFAGLAYSIIEGRNQSTELAKALTLTGNAAGLTEGKFNSLTQTIADSTNTTIGSSREALQGLVASGRFSGDALTETAKATQLLSKVTGQSTDDVVKSFVNMTDGVAKWAETTNRSYHFLTAAQIDYIKSLEEQGNQQKAIEVTMQALNGRLGETAKNVGLLESAWGGVKSAASGALDIMLSIGRVDTPEDKIKQLEAAIKSLDESRSRNPQDAGTRAALVAQLETQRAIVKAQEESAQVQAKSAQTEQAKTAFGKLQEQSLTRQQKLAKELADANALADKAGASASERASVLAGIREKFKDQDLGKATLGLDIEKTKAALAILTDSYKNAEAILEAQRAAGLLSDANYYSQKRKFIQDNADAEVKGLETQAEQLKSSTATGNAAIENQKKLVDVQAKITIAKADAVAKGVILDAQQAASVTKIQRSYADATQAAQAYIDTVNKQNARAVEGIGAGDEFRANQAGRNQIEDKQTTQRQGLERDLRNRVITKDEFDTYLGIANDTYAKEIEAYDSRTAAIKEKQGSWLVGASEAFENYKTNAQNVADQSASAFTNAFAGMTDGFANSISKAIVYGQNLGDSLKNVALSVADAFIASFIKIQTQKLFIDKTTAASYATTLTAQAQAMVAMAGLNAFASTAAIPIVGPLAAPGAAAAAIAAAEGFAASATAAATLSIASARDGFDIPAGVNPITQLHEKEMVLPAPQANVIRDLAKNGGDTGKGGSGAITIVNNTSAKISKVTEQRLSNGERAIIIEEAVAATAAQLSDPNSKTSRSMNRNFSVQRSR